MSGEKRKVSEDGLSNGGSKRKNAERFVDILRLATEKRIAEKRATIKRLLYDHKECMMQVMMKEAEMGRNSCFLYIACEPESEWLLVQELKQMFVSFDSIAPYELSESEEKRANHYQSDNSFKGFWPAINTGCQRSIITIDAYQNQAYNAWEPFKDDKAICYCNETFKNSQHQPGEQFADYLKKIKMKWAVDRRLKPKSAP